ncbi:MAG TPA: hypothetical protein VLZ11_01280 [Flavobacterium sp.]|nr:hypothetical protein [Flavobacterium sp.]
MMRFRNLLWVVFTTLSLTAFSQEVITNQYDAKGNRDGVWTGTHEKSKRLRYEGTFAHGKETGIFKYFDDTKAGKLIATRDFSLGDGSCYVTYFDQKGNKVSHGLLNKDREKQGEWKYYHKESPIVMSVENYNSGKLQGKVVVFYPEGNIASESHYKDGILEGVYKKYTKQGFVIEEIPYVKGQFSGMVTYRDIKGRLYAQGLYNKGLKTGIWKYYKDGKLDKEVDIEAEALKRRAKK